MTTKVSVSVFRDATDHLFRITRDFHACVDGQERAGWATSASAMVAKYAEQTCARAKVEDLESRVRAIGAIHALIHRELDRCVAALPCSFCKGNQNDPSGWHCKSCGAV